MIEDINRPAVPLPGHCQRCRTHSIRRRNQAGRGCPKTVSVRDHRPESAPGSHVQRYERVHRPRSVKKAHGPADDRSIREGDVRDEGVRIARIRCDAIVAGQHDVQALCGACELAGAYLRPTVGKIVRTPRRSGRRIREAERSTRHYRRRKCVQKYRCAPGCERRRTVPDTLHHQITGRKRGLGAQDCPRQHDSGHHGNPHSSRHHIPHPGQSEKMEEVKLGFHWKAVRRFVAHAVLAGVGIAGSCSVFKDKNFKGGFGCTMKLYYEKYNHEMRKHDRYDFSF